MISMQEVVAVCVAGVVFGLSIYGFSKKEHSHALSTIYSDQVLEDPNSNYMTHLLYSLQAPVHSK